MHVSSVCYPFLGKKTLLVSSHSFTLLTFRGTALKLRSIFRWGLSSFTQETEPAPSRYRVKTRRGRLGVAAVHVLLWPPKWNGWHEVLSKVRATGFGAMQLTNLLFGPTGTVEKLATEG